MAYRYGQKLKTNSNKAKKMVAGVSASIAILAGAAVPALAAAGGYGSQPGFDVSNSHTTCAGHGAFGAFGNYGDITHDFGVNNPGSNGQPGADGHQTGLNNSALCGNRQGNL
jgi:hypothetical protein